MQPRFLYSLLPAIFVTLAVAQDLSDLPSCAQQAVLKSIGQTGCQLTDYACICKSSAYISSLTPVIEKDCSPADVQKVSAFSRQLCGSVGVSISIAVSATTPASSSTGLSQTGATTTASASAKSSNGTAGPAASLTPNSAPGAAGSVAFAGRLIRFTVPLSAIGVSVSWLGWL